MVKTYFQNNFLKISGHIFLGSFWFIILRLCDSGQREGVFCFNLPGRVSRERKYPVKMLHEFIHVQDLVIDYCSTPPELGLNSTGITEEKEKEKEREFEKTKKELQRGQTSQSEKKSRKWKFGVCKVDSQFYKLEEIEEKDASDSKRNFRGIEEAGSKRRNLKLGERKKHRYEIEFRERKAESKRERPTIPRIRVSNTRLAQAASGCAPSVDVLPIFDVKQQSVRNPARNGSLRTGNFLCNLAQLRLTRL
ncbi:hypothetical protein WN51_07124 [Melipona quadrifasciata]|uniref:Uncharacterized protein n=1 Tax=Melipona quadrifasciata TaxID=166423 RepID=A0A0M8ZPB7_9HYME|nr:hypothetical protein WN51_07124 [Melipona quadrifasciata]